jgi:hypothetical protein
LTVLLQDAAVLELLWLPAAAAVLLYRQECSGCPYHLQHTQQLAKPRRHPGLLKASRQLAQLLLLLLPPNNKPQQQQQQQGMQDTQATAAAAAAAAAILAAAAAAAVVLVLAVAHQLPLVLLMHLAMTKSREGVGDCLF